MSAQGEMFPAAAPEVRAAKRFELSGRAERLPAEDRFDGRTYEPDADAARLTGLLLAVFEAISDEGWWSLERLADRTGGSEASCSARLRDLRKPKFGRHVIERRRVEGGLFLYRLVTK